MKKYLIIPLLLFTTSISFAQSASGGSINFKELLKNTSIMIGLNQSSYGEDFDDFT